MGPHFQEKNVYGVNGERRVFLILLFMAPSITCVRQIILQVRVDHKNDETPFSKLHRLTHVYATANNNMAATSAQKMH